MKRMFGVGLMLFFNALIGIGLSFVPKLLVVVNQWLSDKGPLIYVLLIGVVAIYAGIVWVEGKLAKWAGIGGNKVLAIICGLLMGATILLGILMRGGYDQLGSFSWLVYLLVIGLGAIATPFIAFHY